MSSGPPRTPGGLRHLWAVYRGEFQTSVAVQLQYRGAQVIWLLGTVLGPLVYLAVWSAVAAASGGEVDGFSRASFAAYYIVLMLVNQVTFSWTMYEFDSRIREGAFSPLLLRPVHPIHADLADNLANKALTMLVLLPTAGVLALVFHPVLHPRPWAILALIPALGLAFAVRFTLEWTLALAAFWTTRTSALNQAYEAVLLFLSGQIAPLALLPGPFRAVADALPFRWMVAFPVQLLTGQPSPGAVAAGLAAQAAWLAAVLLLHRGLWRAATRRYAAVGG
ncbi:MAG TPA: ABC-2 family transporter protein [Bacillota bacterium]|nr:ABC-2 family transporter protein [Bacillota bacterium]